MAGHRQHPDEFTPLAYATDAVWFVGFLCSIVLVFRSDIPGAMVCATRKEAVAKVEALVLRILAARLISSNLWTVRCRCDLSWRQNRAPFTRF
jgi:hypothetical protein